MKVAVAALAGAFFLSGVALAKETTEKLSISGWHCEGCAAKTAAKIQALTGVKSAEADVQGKTLTVTYDDAKITEADIAKVVSDLHYKVVR